ncbi:MAG: hypothetical protein GY771_14110 [bacterium]|nr:hypothetical protein [bacterium]
MKLIGKGLIIDLTSGLEFPDYGDMVLTLGLNVLEVPSPGYNGGYTVPYDAPITGKIAWYDISAELMAAITGSSLSSGTVRGAQAENHQIPSASPYTVTLDNGDIVAQSEIVIRDDSVRMKRVSGSPSSGEYSISGDTLTFSGDDAGKYVYVDYFYEDAAGGHRLSIDPYKLPGSFKLLASLKAYDTYGADYAGEIVAVAEKCRRSGPVEMGSRVGEFGSFGFDFTVENRNPNDLVLNFP